MGSFHYLLSRTDLGTLLQFSPASFVRAVSVPDCLSLGLRIVRDQSDHKGHERRCQALDGLFASRGIAVRVAARSGKEAAGGKLDAAAGQAILQAYFAQILYTDDWLLDFRASAWQLDPLSGQLRWLPARYHYNLSQPFLVAVRALYQGHYQGQEALFKSGLAALGLAPAEAVLREHFGAGDQTAVAFGLPQLQASFAKVFDRCADAGSRVHPEFTALGVALLGLYESLEHCGGLHDVLAAYQRAAGEQPAAAVATVLATGPGAA